MDRFQCTACHYETDRVSWTEAKEQDWDGVVVRRWHPICPACNESMRYVSPLVNTLVDIALGGYRDDQARGF
jgi:ribosomal protein S27AE